MLDRNNKVIEYLTSEVPLRPYSLGLGRRFPSLSREIDFGKWYVPIIVGMIPLVGPFIILFYGLSVGSLNVLLFAVAGLLWGKAKMIFSLWTGTVIAFIIMLVWKARAGKNTIRRFSVPMLILQIALSILAYLLAPPWLL